MTTGEVLEEDVEDLDAREAPDKEDQLLLGEVAVGDMAEVVSPINVEPRLPELRTGLETGLIDMIDLLGTTAGDWQGSVKRDLKVNPSNIYDPELPPGEQYDDSNTAQEAEALDTHRYHLLNIAELGKGQISAMEGGVAALHSVMTDEVMTFLRIESAPEGDTENERLRSLIHHAADLISQNRTDALEVEYGAEHMEDLAGDEHLQGWLAHVATKMATLQEVEPRERPLPGPLVGRIHISGTSVPTEASATKTALMQGLDGQPVHDAFRPDLSYDDAAMESEYADRSESAVALHLITNDKDSIDSLAEAPWLAAIAATRGQRLGILLQKPEDDSPITEAGGKLRGKLEVHLARIQKRYPDLVHVSRDPQELAEWAKAELERFEAVA